MDRRNLLKMAGAAAVARVGAGCDKLVVFDGTAGDGVGLTPITPNAEFYVYACCGMPSVDVETHRVTIAHESIALGSLSRADLEALGGIDKEHTLECIGSTPRIQHVSNAVWTGLPLTDVLDALGIAIPPSAVGLRLVGADDYTAGIPIADLADGPVWLVWRMNGQPLPPEHGAPARLLVPGRYGMKNLKWVTEIAFVDTPHASFWTQYGWSEDAPYLPNTMIAAPLDATSVERGDRVRFLGTAYAGSDPVTAIDVAVDDGPWVPATLDYAPGVPDVWALWSFDWTAVSGAHTIQARCTTASGARSVEDPDGTDRYAGYDGSMRITVEVVG
ncbi:MAG: molybdopterin-dependent oxidoreductase [Myxococcota bacterium]